jgi:hypothetical protein
VPVSDDFVDFRNDLGVRSARTDIAFSIFSPPSTDLTVGEPPMPMIYVRMSPHVASRPRRVVGIGVQNDHPWVYDLAHQTWTDLGFVAHGSNSVGFTPEGDVIAIIDQGRAWWVEGVGKIPNPPESPNYQSGQGFLDVAPYTHTAGQGDGANLIETWQPLWIDDQLTGRVMFEPVPGVRFLRWATDGDFRSGQDAYADRVLVWQFSTATLSIAANQYTSVAPLIGVSSTVGAVCAISLPGLFVPEGEFQPYAPPAPSMPVIGRAAFWTPFEFTRPSRA